MIISFFSFFAIFTSVVSLLPQIYKSYITKSCYDISSIMLINFVISSFSWIVYGILIDAKTVWITNIMMLLCSIVMLYMKLKYNKATI